MTFIRRQKAVIAALMLYWPALFVVAHIPVPQLLRRAHVSDKSLHLLAYMILTFLLWSAIKPTEPVRWRKAAVWCLLAVVAIYGLCDEWLQSFVASRVTDPRDLLADAAGTLAALVLLTAVSFWPASVLIAGATIFTLTVVTRANLTSFLPVTMALFHLTMLAAFTALWMGCLRWWLGWMGRGLAWFAASVSLPLALVLVTTVAARISGKAFEGRDVVAAIAGVVAAIIVARAVRMGHQYALHRPGQ